MQDIENSLKFSKERRFIHKAGEQSRRQPVDTARPNTRDPKGKSVIDESSKQGAKGTQCYRCHDYGHVAARYLSRNLLVEGVDLDDDEFEEIYDPIGSASDTDEDVRVSCI